MKSARSFWKTVRILLLVCFLIFIAMQFIRPPLDNPPVTADLSAPRQVKAIFQRACYDCHSNQTRLAWFDQPAPAYWIVVRDVNAGRKVLNFSNFDSLPKGVQAAKLFECIMQVEQHAMPLPAYTRLHHEGLVSAAEIAVLKEYAGTLGYRPKPDMGRETAWMEQYERWIGEGRAGAGVHAVVGVTSPLAVKDEYNGVAYGPLAGFADWKAVSTTERYDNGTLRLILGNDVTIRAIREGHTNPWPDGAVFAKVAWDQLPDSSGEIHAGVFRQVEFMIRDSKKYPTTFGWGWARWVGGLALTPYGKDGSFVEECMNCHRPVERLDHTFTLPLADTLMFRGLVVLPDSVGKYPLMGKVITTIVHPREGTMSTLYGNDLAVKAARSGQSYPAGSLLSLVTWSQREDPHWFGGRIPRTALTVETVGYVGTGEPGYERCESIPLKRNTAVGNIAERVTYITGLKASVLPHP